MAMAAERLEHEIDPHLEKELQKHPGKWVAMTHSEILAVGDSVQEVLEKAHADSPLLFRVPEGRHSYFF